ncbi:Pycsar system effector family protein [Eubacterium sp.]|uniref:Pycsar system effector family protein n=1 Tax=Eubacterium sp. TaxID=142586 RepID=UPI0025E62924|nr:Pycsar system effector family protein [Eubacterium sp.]MCR5629593.1 DUF5706 domain-containing protein [Eubacterium sp.]
MGKHKKRNNQHVVKNNYTKNEEVDIQNSDNKMEICKYVFDHVNRWIENADNKVSSACAIFTVVFTVITYLAQIYIKEPPAKAQVDDTIKKIYIFAFGLSLVVMFISLVFFLKAIIPNLKSSGKNETKKVFPIYFGDICKIEVEDFQRMIDKVSERQVLEEIITEIHFNSGICMKKMKNYRIAVIFAFGAIILAFVSFGARFFMYT